jgi:2-succinyl-5-enolpyruvyl-6-hydroxy-3-cyclohexene-1-carboxylate synthase
VTDGPGPAYEATLAFFAELAAHGVSDVVISPGSRSTPLAVSARQVGLRPWVQLDERCAGFFALGLARASRRPVPLVCTSGTAAANYLPAVVEASHSGVPLLVCTADRPPELRSWGAGQTIDQLHRYGRDVRWFAELPVGSDMAPGYAVRVAARALAAATGASPGPVHLNFPFREPLEPLGPLPSGPLGPIGPPGSSGRAQLSKRSPEPDRRPTVSVLTGGTTDDQIDLLVDLARRHEHGLIVAGPCDLTDADTVAVTAFASAAGWPLMADPGSQLRRGPHVAQAPILAAGDHLAKVASFTRHHRPDVILRIGLSPTSKALRQWVEVDPPLRLVLVGPGIEWSDPTFTVTDVIDAPPGPVLGRASERFHTRPPGPWLDSWCTADREARSTVTSVTGSDTDLSSPAVVEVLDEVLPGGASLYVSNSMPVRELDMFLGAGTEHLRVFVNRGANGIDGLVAASLGVAAAGGPVVLLTGDVALVHDAGSLLSAARLGLHLVIVVIDNGGGGIFSYLPVAAHGETIGFTELFLTPPLVDIEALGSAAGMAVAVAKDRAGLADALRGALACSTSTLIHVPVDHDADVALHRRVTAAVNARLAP